MSLQCIIVDDEPLAITILEGFIKKIPFLEIVGKFDSAIPVYEFLKNTPIDLIFLDIEMPNISGIDFLKSLPQRPSIILTTANQNYAIEGFDLYVDDYILKPITFERLLKATHRILDTKSNVLPPLKNNKQKDFIYLKENKKMVKVNLKNIQYLESIKDYVKVVTTLKTVITKQQLSYFESTFDRDKFLRIHRSFIVALDKIDSFSLSGIEIEKKELPIGRKYKDEVIIALEKLTKANNENLIDEKK